ncbi:MAG TPA: CoA transferase [Methylomirabilota bacterium]|nr:CoA transferase [Methylomirabilota bacterium]
MPGPDFLQGVTVLDFTRVLAGPYCTRLLADLGARVIKVERRHGDDMRTAPLQLEPGRIDQSTYFVRVNAGKLSVGLDLGHPEGRAVALDLVRVADVVIENFRPGVMERLGLDYRAAAAVRPDLVYCSISGYGQTGPWRHRAAFAHVVHATSGLMHLERDAEEPPRVLYLQAADILAGTHAFGAVMGALLRRTRTGRGAHLDVSMLEALIGAEDISFGSVLNEGPSYPGSRSGMLVQRICGDWIALQIVGVLDLWPRLLALLDRPELAEDLRFATPVARREHWPELRAIIAAWLDRFTSAEEALAVLGAARIPCARVLWPAEVVAAPHLDERGAFPTVAHPTHGAVRVTASPFHIDGEPVGPGGPAPYRPGEDTRAVLAGLLGYGSDRIAELAGRGAVMGPGLGSEIGPLADTPVDE